MPMSFQLSIRPNVLPSARGRILSEAALIEDGLDFLTDHQVKHLRPVAAALIASAARRDRPAAEMAVSAGVAL